MEELHNGSFFFDFVGDLSMDTKCEEELQTSDIS